VSPFFTLDRSIDLTMWAFWSPNVLSKARQ